MVYNAIKYPSPRIIIAGRGALFILFMQQAILNAERWGQALTYETAIGFPALILVFVALVSEMRARDRVDR
jgi:hypothetical protein